jgi:uncharacterized protein involved in oxidation of intracellular sulfur
MIALLILNDPPYGTERSYNGLRLALAMKKVEGTQVRVFLMADSIGCARRGQVTAEGYYNLERMIKGLVTQGAEVATCGTCMDARGMPETDLVEGVRRGNMAGLAAWTLEADRIVTF